jgi:hypothetical protein
VAVADRDREGALRTATVDDDEGILVRTIVAFVR